MRSKKALSIVMSGVLAAALCPAVALAAPAESEALEAATPALQTQAAKTVVYVPAKIVKKTIQDNGKSSVDSSTTFKYKTSGLLYKRIEKSGSNKTTTKWLYSGSSIRAVKNNSSKLVFDLTKSGKWKSGTWTMPASSSDKVYETYKYSGSLIKSCKQVTYWTDTFTGLSDHSSVKYVYTYNSKKLPVKVTTKYTGSSKSVNKYSYDSHGNVVTSTGYGDTTKYKNTYNANGLLKTHTEIANYEGSDVTSYSITYKPVKVKSSLVSKVKKQRWAILNSNLNCAIGGEIMN